MRTLRTHRRQGAVLAWAALSIVCACTSSGAQGRLTSLDAKQVCIETVGDVEPTEASQYCGPLAPGADVARGLEPGDLVRIRYGRDDSISRVELLEQ